MPVMPTAAMSHAIDFSNYEAGVKSGDWLERSLLRPEGTLSRIERTGEEGFVLTRADEDVWEAGDAALDAYEVRTFVGRFTGLSVTGTSDAELPEEATATFHLTDDDGMQELTLYQQDDDYIATSSRIARPLRGRVLHRRTHERDACRPHAGIGRGGGLGRTD